MNCHNCYHSRAIPGDCHLDCREGLDQCFSGKTVTIRVKINEHGARNGWAHWPFNFDPIWIESCNSFKERECATQ